jgi:hypothetical protein
MLFENEHKGNKMPRNGPSTLDYMYKCNTIASQYENKISKMIEKEILADYDAPKIAKNFNEIYSLLKTKYEELICDMQKEISSASDLFIKEESVIIRGMSFGEAEDEIKKQKEIYENMFYNGPGKKKSFQIFFVEDILPIYIFKSLNDR